MCDDFRDNKWELFLKLSSEDKKTLGNALACAIEYVIRLELDAETEEDRKLYLQQEKKFGALVETLFPSEEIKLSNEKSYRPFTLDELGPIGTNFKFRNRETREEYFGAYNGYRRCRESNGSTYYVVSIGCYIGSLLKLFEHYELLDRNGRWHAFGAEE